MKKFSVILLLAALLLTACNPLRRVQRNQKADSTAVEQSEIRKVVTDILRESGTLSQTVIEFYPPGNTGQPVGKSGPQPSVSDIGDPKVALPATEQPQPPAIKRIIKTEIATETQRATTTDSTALNDIRTDSHRELSDEVVEKPPATVSAIKWIVTGLVALLLIIVILKFPKIKLPRIKWPNQD